MSEDEHSTGSKGLEDAIIGGRYRIYLQPKYDFHERIKGAEALIRQDGEGRTEIPENIGKWEREGYIYQIDLFVLEEVCQLLQGREDLRVSLNFSRATLMEEGIVERMEKIRKKYDIEAERVEIEITETLQTKDRKAEAKVIEEIDRAGYRLSLDDFGAEYSNLLYLVIHPFDSVKLDKSLIDEIERNWKDRLLLESIVKMCHDMKIEITAEGVETQEQYEYLRKIGCDLVQGYLTDRPMSEEAFREKYDQQRLRIKK